MGAAAPVVSFAVTVSGNSSQNLGKRGQVEHNSTSQIQKLHLMNLLFYLKILLTYQNISSLGRLIASLNYSKSMLQL